MASGNYDIAIVGGGLVGASLASALSGLGLRIVLVEAVPLREPGQPSYDDRTLALSLASVRIFEGIGLWPGVKDGVTPIHEVLVSERGRFGGVRIAASDLQVPVLGYVAEGRVIGRAVVDRLQAMDDVDMICPARVTALKQTPNEVRLTVDAQGELHELEVQMLIGADGTGSWVRETLGLDVTSHDYGQTAIIANVTPGRPHENRAFERLTDTGPLAMLPHVGKRCGVVWTVPTEKADALLAMDDESFLAGLQKRFGYRLGRFSRAGRRSGYPLRLVYAPRQAVGRCLVLGNAAHTIHPVSAQGFNLGLRDVAVLAELIHGAWTREGDPCSEGLLAEYQRLRHPDHQRMIAYTDGLVRGFAQSFLPVQWLRSAGLVAVQLVPGLKRALARRTMGFGGHVPRLAQGLPLE